jgi:hypothetical protein
MKKEKSVDVEYTMSCKVVKEDEHGVELIMNKKPNGLVEFIIVKVEEENEYLVDEYIKTYKRFVRKYDENLFLDGGKVCIEGDATLWVIREIVYKEEFDLNIVYIINRCQVLNIEL